MSFTANARLWVAFAHLGFAVYLERKETLMNQGIKRSILRSIHLLFSIPIFGYIYSPFQEIPKYAPAVRFVFLPILVLSGLWMWKGHVLRRLTSKRAA